jgi:hypothetical protein
MWERLLAAISSAKLLLITAKSRARIFLLDWVQVDEDDFTIVKIDKFVKSRIHTKHTRKKSQSRHSGERRGSTGSPP